MAFNSQRNGIASVSKRFINQIWSPSSSLTSLRRGVHVSLYDKNVDEQVRPSIVPDDVIQPQSDKYWTPNPQTGVFGPAEELRGVGEGGLRSTPVNAGVETQSEQQVWFRPLEDIEKPQPEQP